MGAEISCDNQCGYPARMAGTVEELNGERSPTISVPCHHRPAGRPLPTLLGSSETAPRTPGGGKEKGGSTPAAEQEGSSSGEEVEGPEDPAALSCRARGAEGELPVLGVEEEDVVEEVEASAAALGSFQEPSPRGAAAGEAEAAAAEGPEPVAARRSRGGNQKSKRKAERTEAKAQVKPFLERGGFKSVNSRRNWLWASYPLHRAVRENDPETVRLLVKAGADPKKADALGRTPHQLAESKDREGSHAAVLAALGSKRRNNAYHSSSSFGSLPAASSS